LFVLAIALSVASAPTVGYSPALSLDAPLPIVLTIVHFGGTSILSLHTMLKLFFFAAHIRNADELQKGRKIHIDDQAFSA
jgi:hypothetical protein